MLLQRITLAKGENSELYFRGGSFDGEKINVKCGERLSFDTYFGSFTYTKYRDYTTLRSVEFRAWLTGEAEVSLCTFDGNTETEVSSGRTERGYASVSVDITALPSGAFLYPVIKPLSDELEFVEGAWVADDSIVTAEPEIAIAICTYKREEYLRRNLQILERSAIKHLKSIIVVDNGGTLSEDIESSLVRLCRNKNYGGSAGFTRGLMEAAEGHTHVILMDDDIVIFPEAIERMAAFISILRPQFKNAHFSAAMLRTSDMAYQHEKGALWNGKHIESLNSGLYVKEKYLLFENLSDGDIKYGAWWCFCLPTSDVREYGLPLPLFLKFDDVEYGERCCKNAPIITMSGMAVAHADFDLKYNMSLEYYTVRNQLIMLACHKKQNRFGCIARLIKVSAKHLFMYRYEAAPIILRAFTDFLRGPSFLESTDAEELNRSVMAMSPKLSDLSLLEPSLDEIKRSYRKRFRKPVATLFSCLTLGTHLIPNIFLPKKPSYLPLSSDRLDQCFLHKNTVQYQVEGNMGYVFKKNSLSFFSCFLYCLKMSFKILFGYGKAARAYRERFSYLTSEQFWKSYLGLEEKK